MQVMDEAIGFAPERIANLFDFCPPLFVAFAESGEMIEIAPEPAGVESEVVLLCCVNAPCSDLLAHIGGVALIQGGDLRQARDEGAWHLAPLRIALHHLAHLLEPRLHLLELAPAHRRLQEADGILLARNAVCLPAVRLCLFIEGMACRFGQLVQRAWSDG